MVLAAGARRTSSGPSGNPVRDISAVSSPASGPFSARAGRRKTVSPPPTHQALAPSPENYSRAASSTLPHSARPFGTPNPSKSAELGLFERDSLQLAQTSHSLGSLAPSFLGRHASIPTAVLGKTLKINRAALASRTHTHTIASASFVDNFSWLPLTVLIGFCAFCRFI